MSPVAQIMKRVIMLAIGLALAGKLASATIHMMKLAAGAHQTGLISLGKLNRSLWAEPPRKKQRK